MWRRLMTTVKLEGFRELDQALMELPKATAKSVLRRVAKGALEPMAAMAAGRAPERTGKLSFSIAVSEKRTRRAKGSSAKKLIGGQWRSDPKTSIEMAMGPAGGLGTLSYATWAEFGTSDTVAKPFMRPSWDSGSHAALGYIKSQLRIEIDKAAARAARKAAKLRG
jgi:HK97 gp10 family phage protein